jgi:hypothetical protein
MAELDRAGGQPNKKGAARGQSPGMALCSPLTTQLTSTIAGEQLGYQELDLECPPKSSGLEGLAPGR